MNSNNDEHDDVRGLASSPCMLHEFEATDESSDVAGWRRAERKRQLAERLALDVQLRKDHAVRIAAHLEDAIGDIADITVSFYWPIRGEPDLRELIDRIARRGGRCALPVVSERNQPLIFRTWARGERLERGFWNIPVPMDGVSVIPDVIIVPLVAFDRSGYRLGYGGGYFDRTLAAISAHRRVIGVGYSMAAIDTIYPQPHDIPMDVIVTESGARDTTQPNGSKNT
jgi:5,10-methenyltetrahydrofolate synthetase